MRVQDFLLAPGDFLISRSNTLDKVGRTVLFRGEIENCSYPDLLMRFRVDETQVTNEYLEGYLRSSIVRTYIQRSASGTSGSMVKINKSTVEKIPVVLPTLPEQKAIADLLSTWDEAIEKTERLIQAKEKRFKELLRELIAEQINREKETGWKKVRIGSFLTESRIQDRDNDPKKRLSVRLHLKGVEVREYRGTESDGATAYFIRKAGQFIYGKQNIFKGAVGIVPLELDGYSSTQDIPAFDVADHVDKHWLLFLFSYSNFYKKLELYASGSGSKRLQPKELFRMKISLPPFEVQQKIAEALFFAQEEIDLLKQLAEKYKTQKRGLMQKMLTGEWRVKQEGVKSHGK
ncbi:MAG: restriction endonuclease subunit S [Prosthecochloris sp.]|nr:restriction endonuclease subunit S [Prosthecochloris sp.]